jgi:hypothetical protein
VNASVRFDVFAFKLWHALRKDGKEVAFLDGMVHREVYWEVTRVVLVLEGLKSHTTFKATGVLQIIRER